MIWRKEFDLAKQVGKLSGISGLDFDPATASGLVLDAEATTQIEVVNMVGSVVSRSERATGKNPLLGGEPIAQGRAVGTPRLAALDLHFDPQLMLAFKKALPEILRIKEIYADENVLQLLGIFPKIEEALQGKAIGESVQVKLQPDDCSSGVLGRSVDHSRRAKAACQ